jgi:conjugative relaxase-like TrwC/TraI family protein
VLILAKITSSSAGGYAEYLEGKVQASSLGDYYLKDGERIEAPGRWAQGANHFDLDATAAVTGEQLRALMAVRRPDGGGQLRRTGGSGEAVAAIDATFSAPKSVSATWAIADPQLRARIEQAHETAIDRALTYATRQVPMLRRRVNQDKVLHEKATGLVATSWRHTTARAVAEQVPDPQLHSHVLLHAAVRRDGRLLAIDSRSWLVHQREVGAAYRSELAHELQDLGFAIRRGTGRGGRYFEIDGIPQGLLDRWSSRHHQVQAAITERLGRQERELAVLIARQGPEATEAAEQLELLQRTGQLSPKQERLMGTVTRTVKAAVTAQDLDNEWQRTALQYRIGRERLELLRRMPKVALEPAAPEDVLVALTEFDATFAAREARAAALERSAGTPIAVALKQLRALRNTGEILLLADGTGTTKDHRGYERAVVAITGRLTATTVEPIPVDASVRETERLDRELATTGGRLSDEQRAAIQLACGEHPLVVIEGHAGTGKSTTLTGIARAHQASGREIIVTSTAALAAERLATELQEHGVQCAAYSTAGLHAAINHGRVELSPDTTVIHDEAALASTREQLRLMRAVETSGARLIAVGDPQQNQPVGAGGLWDQIEEAVRGVGAHVELTRKQRARHPADRHAQTLFRNGEIELAIRTYHARDRVHIDPDQQRAEDRALEAADRDRAEGKTTIVIAQTSNEHLDELNARAQAIRRQRRELGDNWLEIPGRPYQLHARDHVQIRHTINHPEHGPLRNGTNATVIDVDADRRELKLRFADGREILLNEREIEQADLRLAYVQHPFPAQGHTTDTTHVIIAGHATREGTYVAITRAREQTRIYYAPSESSPDTDRLGLLAERVSKTEPEMPSISTPLRQELAISEAVQLTTADETPERGTARVTIDQETERRRQEISRSAEPKVRVETLAPRASSTRSHADDTAVEPSEATLQHTDTLDLTADREHDEQIETTLRRVWPSQQERESLSQRQPTKALERDETPGWEP